jgi:hypothetical protein
LGVSPALVVSDTAPTPPVDGQQWLGLSSEILSIWSTTKNRWIVPVTEDFNSTVAAFYFFDATAVSSVVVADPLDSPLLVAEWLSTAGPNDLGRKFVQATSLNQPRYVGSNRVVFNDSSDVLDFDAAVSRAGWQIVGTSRGTFAYRVNANSITGINLFGNRGAINTTGDLYGIILLPSDVTPAMVQKARQILIDRGAANEVVGTAVIDWWRGRSDIVEFPLRDFSAVTNFTFAWFNCTNLTSFPLINTAAGTLFNATWQNCTKLTSFPLLNTAAATNLTGAWQGCAGLTSFPLINTGAVINFQNAWLSCATLTSFPLINTAAGTNFAQTWRNCLALTSFPLINTAAGTNFQQAWQLCSALTSFPLINTAAGTNFNNTWQGCAGLTSFPLINTAAGTNFTNSWSGCSSLTSFPLINMSSGTSFVGAWFGCSSLTSFPAIDMPNGTLFNGAWRNCTGLTSFPLINTASATSYQDTWRNCTSLATFPANFFNSWTGTPAANCFLDTWLLNNSLTATSVENIFNSIDASGKSAPATGTEITVEYNAASGTPNITTAITNLKARGWTPRLNGTLL